MGPNGSRQTQGHDCLDRVFVALGHRHRRQILSRLVECSPRDVEQLLPPDDGRDRDRLTIELHHRHLPKLADGGFVEWDGEHEVRRGPKFEAVASVIELFDTHENRLPGEWP